MSSPSHSLEADRPWVERIYVGEDHLSFWSRVWPGYWLGKVGEDIRLLYEYRFVLQNMVLTQIRIRYHRSVLGFFWTFLNPLLLLGVQAVAFSQVLRINIKDYALYLFSGLIAWQFFQASVDSASRSLIGNEGLIRKIAAPKLIFPLTDVLVGGVNLLFTLPALFLFFLIFGAPIRPQVVLLIPGFLLLLIFVFGFSLISMTLATFFRDFTHIISIVLSAWYFASPVLYPPSLVKDFDYFLRFNPMTYFLEFFHNALISADVLLFRPGAVGGLWPSPATWIIACGCAFGTLILGYALYKANENEYIFRL